MPEPIKVMQNELACVNRQITGCDRDCIKCDLVLEDSEIIAVYEAAIEALKKQRPQKPSYIDEDYGIFECPTCKTLMDSSCQFKCWHYCMNCGQALDWSEVEE